MDSAAQIESLLEHADWVRRLARSLVVDSARAEDVAQEAWVAALKTPPRESQNLRAWLGTVVRNAARRDARSTERREARQAAAAREEALPSAAELVEQADLQRELAALVIALDEPYRQTLLLRYYRGLSAEEIATRAGVPLNTVRTRMQRGLEKLRERLDRRFGERGAWCAALAPMLGEPLVQGSIVSATGVLIMATKMKWLAAAAALLLGLWLWWPREAATAPKEELASAPKLESPLTEAPPAEPTAPLDGARVALNPAPTPPVAEEAPPRVVSSVHGRCVDLAGAPLAGLEIEWIDGDETRLVQAARGAEFHRPHVRTAIDGTFRIEQESHGGEIGLVRKDLMILDSVHVAEFPEGLLVVAPCRELTGTVIDADHAGIPGAKLQWNYSLDAARSFPYVVEANAGSGAWTVCDARGAFRLEHVPALSGCKLLASAHGFVETWVDVAAASELELTIVLASDPRAGDQHIAGSVQYRDGRPVAGAHVDFGAYGATSGDDGSFRIDLPYTQAEDTPLTAFAKGARPVALAEFGKKLPTSDVAIDDVLLVLDEALPPIRGRVLDAEGKPCANWGAALIGAERQGSGSESLEATASGETTSQTTDAEGRFQFSGLLDHEYRVRAWNAQSMIAIESEAVAPGATDLVLRVPADARIEKVFGRVISRRGMPIDGAVISIGVVAFEIEGGGQTLLFHEGSRTDALGRFELRDVPRNRCLIGASDKRIQGHSIEFDASMAEKELVIEVDLDLRFRIEPRRSGEFDRIRVLDRAGAAVYVHTLHLSGENYAQVVEPVDGVFPMCSTDESAETLVLDLGEREIRRLPLLLHAGEITLITP